MTHWRKGDKSDFLMSWDIEGEQKATIIKVVRETKKVRGQEGSFRVAYFKEPLKPIIINVLNGTILQNHLGTHQIENWGAISIPVILFVDENVKFGKTQTRGLRLRIDGGLPLMVENSTPYKNAVAHLRDGKPMADIEKRFTLSDEIKLKLESDANS